MFPSTLQGTVHDAVLVGQYLLITKGYPVTINERCYLQKNKNIPHLSIAIFFTALRVVPKLYMCWRPGDILFKVLISIT